MTDPGAVRGLARSACALVEQADDSRDGADKLMEEIIPTLAATS